MLGTGEIYTATIRDNLRPLFANWEPATPIELGDYGLLHDGLFSHLGNIRTLKFTFGVREHAEHDHKSFSSKGKTQVSVHAKGKHYAKATLQISFQAADAVFFNAADCKHILVEDKVALGRKIMDLFRRKEWKKSWVVVTEIVKAGSTTVAISGSDASSLVLEASADIPHIDLADASAGLQLRSENSVGFHVIAKKGLTPLFGLSGIQSPFLGFNKSFDPLVLGRVFDSAPRSAAEDQDVFFGDLNS